MELKKISWLHLSDFHVGLDNYGQAQLFSSILKHVREQIAVGTVPDFLFITGDLSNRGLAKEYQKFNSEFLEPLQELIGNKIDERTFAVPGNHDVDRSRNPGFSAEKFLDKASTYFDPTAEGLDKRKFVLERFKHFFEEDQTATLGEWIMSADGAFSSKQNINGLDVGIVCINTALLSEKANEKKLLSPGQYIVDKAIANVESCDVKIVLGHHPINWFADIHARPIDALFGKNNVIYLHGHLHEVWGVPKYGGGHPYMSIQSGAAFQAREDQVYKNGLLWGEINYNEEIIRLQPWSWNKNHQEWSVNSEAFPNSNRKLDTWEFPLPGKKKL